MIEVEVQGLAELAAKLKALPAELASKSGGPLRFALQKAGKVFAEEANHNAAALPVSDIDNRDEYDRTGKLAKSVNVRRVANPDPGVTEQVLVRPTKSSKTPYWHLVEFGTESMPARPFLRPAFDSRVDAALEEFKGELAKAIERATKRGIKRGLISG